ncbi:MAG: CGNR zinc finger domain-containing protein [Micromonosporaceae bacterium]
MDYGAYTESSVTLMVELANTYDVSCDPPEKLDGVPAVEEFLRTHRMLGDTPVTERDLTTLREWRDRIRDVLKTPDEADQLDRLNALLDDARARPRVVSNGGKRELSFACDDASPVRRVAADAGIGLAMMLVEHADRLKVCAAAPCRDVFVDQSKNRCRRYCSDTCGSRATVAAFRQRQRESATTA